MPVILWARNRYAKWLAAAFMILWTVMLWVMSRETGRAWVRLLYFLILPLQLSVTYGSGRHVLVGGVLAVVRRVGAVQRVPLAAAELKRNGTRLRLRWPEGRRMQALSARVPAPFADALERVTLSARSAKAGSVPTTAAEAAQAVTFGFPVDRKMETWVLFGALAFVGLFGVAIWRNLPLLLLPLAILAWLAYRDDMGRLLMLSGDHLWMLRPSEEPHPIPVTAVQGTIPGTQITVIVTRDSRYPEIRLNQYQSGDLLKQLKRRLQGESAVLPREAQLESAAESVLRCTLCGRPVPGTRADGTVHICDLCAGRTRIEAAAGGHGLTGKDPTPM